MQSLNMIILGLISLSFIGAVTAIIIFSLRNKQENYQNLLNTHGKNFIVHPVSAMPYI